MGEKCWINMLKCAFYIIERPHVKDISEFKEDDDAVDREVNIIYAIFRHNFIDDK
jgi:phosphate uptake regulator